MGEGQDVAQDRVTVQEAARRLGVKKDAVRKRIQRGRPRRYRPNQLIFKFSPLEHPYVVFEYDTVHVSRSDAREPAKRAAETPLFRDRELQAGGVGAVAPQREGAHVMDRGRDQREGLCKAPRFPS
jgi:hypothetical protein